MLNVPRHRTRRIYLYPRGQRICIWPATATPLRGPQNQSFSTSAPGKPDETMLATALGTIKKPDAPAVYGRDSTGEDGAPSPCSVACHAPSKAIIRGGNDPRKTSRPPDHPSTDRACQAAMKFSALQLRRTAEEITAPRLMRNVPFYRQSFEHSGRTPRDLHSLSDLAKFPSPFKTDYAIITLACRVPATSCAHPCGHRARRASQRVVGYTEKTTSPIGRTVSWGGPACCGAQPATCCTIAYGMGCLRAG